MSLSPLIAVVGPTGSGKSDLALSIAAAHGGEVVNSDSIQLYRYFDVGSAKLSLSERQNIPHHLIDVLDPDQEFSAGEYARLARQALAGITARGTLPVVVGGTGFYLRALLEGLFPGPGRDQAVRDRLAARETSRPGSLHRLLTRFDPPTAARIHPTDVQKLIRAVEVRLLTRRPPSELYAAGRDALQGYRILKIGVDPPRQALYSHLDERCRRMFEQGLVQEVRHILALGYPPTSKPFESLGYRQALQLVEGQLTPEQALLDTQQATRRYAKRQWTWFRRDPELQWFPGFGHDDSVQVQVLQRIASFLEGFGNSSALLRNISPRLSS
jgi:tRNA dimethylallyltransferase